MVISSILSLLGLHDVALWLSQRPLLWPHLAEPLWLLLLLLPVGAFVWRWRARQKILHYADESLQPWAMVRAEQTQPTLRARIRRALIGVFWLMFWLALTLTLANPVVPKAKNEQLATRPPVLFVVDHTAAMSVADVSPDRQSRAVALLELLEPALRSHRLGLMIDTDEAGLLLPPTGDADLFTFYLKQLTGLKQPLVVPRPDRAFAWIAQMPDMHGGVVVWLTSGDQASFAGAIGSRQLAAAEALKKADIRLIAVTVAGAGGPMRKAGLPIKNAEEQVLTSDPAPQRVAELAHLTGGVATQTRTLPADVAFVRQAVAAVPNRAPEQGAQNAQRSLHALPLLLAWISLVLLAVLLLRPSPKVWLRRDRPRKNTATALSVLVLMASIGLLALQPISAKAAEPAHAAAPWLSQSADQAQIAAGNRALKRGNYAEAQVAFSAAKGFAARFGNGLAAFRRADYAFAADQWQLAVVLATNPHDKALAAFNLGDALTLAGRYAEARDAFTYVLSLKPIRESVSAAALTNRAILEKMLQSFAKNSKNSPRFQGHQAAKYGYYHDPKQSRMDKTIQKSQGATQGGAAAAPQPAKPVTPFVLNAATESSARAKLTLIHNTPAPLLDSLLRQQPYHPPRIGAVPLAKEPKTP